METDDLAGTAAIVTGASRGLGRAFALDLVAAGANVTSTARSAEGLLETASSVPGVDRAYCASKAAVSQLTSCLAAEVANDGVTVLAFGPAALTSLARSLFETEAMPAARRQFYETYFTANPDELLRTTLDLFGFLVRGGGDHLSGHYVGSRVDGFDTPDDLRERPSPC